jgi:hypothetical protein
MHKHGLTSVLSYWLAHEPAAEYRQRGRGVGASPCDDVWVLLLRHGRVLAPQARWRDPDLVWTRLRVVILRLYTARRRPNRTWGR